jgi:hypothetical protein
VLEGFGDDGAGCHHHLTFTTVEVLDGIPPPAEVAGAHFLSIDLVITSAVEEAFGDEIDLRASEVGGEVCREKREVGVKDGGKLVGASEASGRQHTGKRAVNILLVVGLD